MTYNTGQPVPNQVSYGELKKLFFISKVSVSWDNYNIFKDSHIQRWCSCPFLALETAAKICRVGIGIECSCSSCF